MSITRINEFQAADGKAAELFAFLQSLIPYISLSQGCESCEVLRCSDDASLFVVLERWDCESSHKNSIERFPKEEMAAAMPLIGAPPKGNYYYS